jgi:hypothetical protein
MRGNIKRLGLYGEDLSRLVRRSREASFALRATARPLYEGRALARRRRGEGGRDSMKVAQYEVLGNEAKRQVRPVRDDRNARLLVSYAAQQLPTFVYRPSRDGYLFKNADPALRTGLLSSGPCGTDSL